MIASAILFLSLGVWSVRKVAVWFPRSPADVRLAIAGSLCLTGVLWLPIAVARLCTLSVSLWLAPACALALAIGAWAQPNNAASDRTAAADSALPRRYWLILAGMLALHLAGHWYHDLRPHLGGYWSAGAAWEDQSFHSALATSVSLGDNLYRIGYPHLLDQPLAYPFIPDFQAGWMHAAGVPLPWCFIVANGLASAVFLVAAFALLRTWLRSETKAIIALAIWHLAGGFGIFSGVASLWDGLSTHGWLKNDYANDWALDLHFHNFTTAIVWPMRVAWIGLAIAAGAIVWTYSLLDHPTAPRSPRIALGLTLGALPLISSHALVCVACAVAPRLVPMLFRPGGKAWWRWTLSPAVALALPQAIWLAYRTSGAEPGFLRWQMGWMVAVHGGSGLSEWASHWAWNTGLWVTLGLSAVFLNRRLTRATLGFWLILLVGQLIVFQPFAFDNIKLFALFGLAPAAGCAWWLAQGWRGGTWAKLGSVGLGVLCVGSGVQSVISEAANPSEIVNAEGIRFAEAVARSTPRDAVILTGPHLHHPVLILAGRRVVAANPSGLTLHGIPHMDEHIAAAAKLYEGGADAHAEMLAQGIGYIVIGPMERTAIPHLNEARLRTFTDVVVADGPWQLLAVRSTPALATRVQEEN